MFAEGLTSKGRVREQNQDAFVCSLNPVGNFPNLFIIADGMGGHNSGDIASEMAIDYFCTFIRKFNNEYYISRNSYLDVLASAVRRANKKVYENSISNESNSGMGTTLTACSIIEDKAYIVHVGDSRLYTISPRKIKRVTTDHSYVEEMLRKGKITPEEAKISPYRNMITNVLGTEPNVRVDGIIEDLTNVSMILLCSDGLSNMLSDKEILETVYASDFMGARVENLIDAANNNGGTDNISVVLVSM